MSERCSHVQCGALATARVAFDALSCFVWIDPYESAGPRDVGARGAGALCTRHADRLVPPRGWSVQDRRVPEPQLWSDRPPVTVPPASMPLVGAVTHAAGDARVVAVDEPLPFGDDPASDIEQLLGTARSPMLARAFHAAHPRQAD